MLIKGFFSLEPHHANGALDISFEYRSISFFRRTFLLDVFYISSHVNMYGASTLNMIRWLAYNSNRSISCYSSTKAGHNFF